MFRGMEEVIVERRVAKRGRRMLVMVAPVVSPRELWLK